MTTTTTIEQFRPMLADKLPCAKNHVPTQEEVIRDLERLDWSEGFFISPKLDGIRCIKHPTHGLVTRTLTQIPNRFMQECLSPNIFDHFDGEITKGTPNQSATMEFNDTQSAVMSQSGSPFFTFNVFDHIEHPNVRFDWRTSLAKERVATLLEFVNFQNLYAVQWVPQSHVRSIDDLLRAEEEYLELGYEGIIIRDPSRRYKNNRSTFKQQGMIKLKRFLDAEAVIIGFEELSRNTNVPENSKLGFTKRSSKLEGQVPGGTLGKLVVEGLNGRFRDTIFRIGVGFDDKLRDTIWANKQEWLGAIIKYKYQDVGSKNAPRIPTYLGKRDPRDL